MGNMKKFVILIIFTFIAGGVFLAINRHNVDRNLSADFTPAPKTLGVKEVGEAYQIKDKDRIYNFDYFMVENTDNLSLIPNFQERSTAEDLLIDHKCKKLISGGFYTKEHKPIGLFIFDGGNQRLRNVTKNSLFNSVLSINDFGIPRITRNVPKDHLVIALQSGPLLIENSFLIKNSVKNDGSARRIIGAVTGKNKLMFLAIYDPKNVYDGPVLTDLPRILADLNEKYNLGIADAVNLDGGSASAFYAGEIKLSELTFIGSAFCLKE